MTNIFLSFCLNYGFTVWLESLHECIIVSIVTEINLHLCKLNFCIQTYPQHEKTDNHISLTFNIKLNDLSHFICVYAFCNSFVTVCQFSKQSLTGKPKYQRLCILIDVNAYLQMMLYCANKMLQFKIRQ